MTLFDPTLPPAQYLAHADLIHDEAAVRLAIAELAAALKLTLHDSQPLVLCVMGGAVVLAGQLLPLLDFPLEFDYVQASRYHNQTQGQTLLWKVLPSHHVKDRIVVLIDDILDEGHTLAAIREKCLEQGASRVVIAVLAEKLLGHEKPIRADHVGLQVPNRYVFGCGMDVYGWWRNLPAIYALPEEVSPTAVSD
ncbi:hypoxanthine-guanine phosphoribosyltransferase [Methylobacillus flagellatus]|uniref:hypoxanthine-guanine phosphoribosyltransferase n=1 Tax=Methylobacillus flagellatus TaxID=405 RepID=UPI0010F8D1F4|nr:hypoxanthine-guanine phosphoribosyltransferase [Methylobacillus flagellatus]